MDKVLIVDDDKDICLLLEKFLKKKDYDTAVAHRGMDAIEMVRKSKFDLVLCDFKLPDADGLEVLQKIKILSPTTIVIIITGYSDVKMAVQTVKHGAHDYVTKPLYPDEILHTIQNALSGNTKAAGSEKTEKKKVVPQPRKFIFGKSNSSETLRKHIDLIAPTDMSVIIMGETGTGKEFVANAIHQKSARAGKPFVAIDCGALPKELAGSELFGHVKGAFTGALFDKKGSFEVADGGTLFLDEIANLSYENQIKLLRVLQERKIKKVGGNNDISIDVRILTASNEDLKEAARRGDFREDLYHRLNEFRIELPALRERKTDIMTFAYHFLALANEDLGKEIEDFDEVVKEKLKEYYWHGNLRELRNVIKRAVLLSSHNDTITLASLPQEIVAPVYFEEKTMGINTIDTTNLRSVSENAERNAIISVLEKTGYNKTKAAEVLKIDRKTLYNKLKAYDINL